MQVSNIEFMAKAILELGRVESDFIEYKKSAKQRDSILKTACAFANNYMNRKIGLIFIGVEEMDTESGEKAVPKRPIAGIDEALLETTENGIKGLLAEIHPRITYHLLDVKVDDRTCLVIAVEPGSDGPYETSAKAEGDKGIRLRAGRYIRVRRDTRFPNKREEFELLKKFADFHFSSELNETATLDDLNYEWMREYLVRTNAAQDVRALPKLEMAQALGLVSGSEYGGYRARNFAVLMFADRPQDFIPYARVEIIREAKDTDRMEATVFDGPIWVQVEQAKRFFKEVIQRSYTVRPAPAPANHRIVYNWPEVAFAELLTNAVLHREYDRKQYVGVYVYRDMLSFINHNRPLPPVTIEDMNAQEEFRDRNYLNPEITRMFHALGLIESYGSGIRRAKHAMHDNGNPPLYFEPTNDTDDYTMVTCPINEEFAYIRDHEDETTRETSEKATPSAKENDARGSGDAQEATTDAQESGRNAQEATTDAQESGRNAQEATTSAQEISSRIIRALTQDSSLNARELSLMLNEPYDTVRYWLRKLRSDGRIRHEGSTKAGQWIVLKSEDKDNIGA